VVNVLKEITSVYTENDTKHINAKYELFVVKIGITCSYHCAILGANHEVGEQRWGGNIKM
jgi:hypothetical protein